MPNAIYRDRLTNSIRYAVTEAANAKRVDHAGLKGLIRELLVSQAFAPMLPTQFEIGRGKICDQLGGQSSETDLVIYNRGVLPPIMYGEREGMYPIESCYYSIEVKSRATAAEIQDAVQKGKELLDLYYIGKERQQGNRSPVILAFFAFDSDLSKSGITELERYANNDPNFNDDPILKTICVVGRGYWYHRPEDRAWTFHPPTAEYDEVIDLVSGVTNTLLKQPLMRSALLGHYLMEHREVVNHPGEGYTMPQDLALLDQWVGETVLVDYTSGPQHANIDTATTLYEGRTVIRGSLEVKQTYFTLEAYNEFGIEVRYLKRPKNVLPFFMPWGAVLRIMGTEADVDSTLTAWREIMEADPTRVEALAQATGISIETIRQHLGNASSP